MIRGLLASTCMLLALSNKGKGMWRSSEWGGSVRDDPNNGSEGDQFSSCVNDILIHQPRSQGLFPENEVV